MSDDERWLQHAIDLATESAAGSSGPFGAVVVRGGLAVGVGTNRVTADLDPTAHAEVVAIRAACREVGYFTLAGTALFASCEPCPLCLSAALWSRLDRVVFAGDRHMASRAGFDDAVFHGLLGATRGFEGWPMLVTCLELSTAEQPFDAWRANPARTAY